MHFSLQLAMTIKHMFTRLSDWHPLRLGRALRSCQRGNVAIIFGLAMTMVVISMGMGVDLWQAYVVKARLQAAVDSAALAIGSTDPTKFTDAQLQDRVQQFFTANYPVSGQLGTPSTPSLTYGSTNNIINVSATASVPTTFMPIVNVNSLSVSATGQVTRGIQGLEVALVLDNTGSMLCGDGGTSNCSSGVPPSHITTLVSNANTMINTLFSNTTDLTKLKMAVVPYVTTVNAAGSLCSGATTCNYVATDSCSGDFLDYKNNIISNAVAPLTKTATTTNNSASITNVSSNTTGILVGMSVSGTGIQSGSLVTLINSSSKITLSKKATSNGSGVTLTFQQTGATVSGTKILTNLQTTSGLSAGMVITGTGIPANTAIKTVDTLTQITLCNNATATGTPALSFATRVTFDTTQAENTTQWKGCVVEPTTSGEDSTGVGPDITEPGGGWTTPWNAFYWQPNTYTSGTNTWTNATITYLHTDGNVGTAWNGSEGPNNGCPTPLVRLTNSQTTLNAAANGMKSWAAGGTQIHVGMIWGWRAVSPNPPFADGLAYNTPNWSKVVILETDGQNEIPDSDHLTGLGFLADGKFGSTSMSTAMTNINNRLATVCANMKTAGIIIYTIGLGQGATGTTSSTLKSCATDDAHFFAAPTGADLSTAFQSIATSLNNLRLSK